MAGEGTAGALAAGDRLLAELDGGAHVRDPQAPKAETMGRLQKVSYTHEALIELIIAEPTLTQNQLAARFGYTPGWISNILASDAFQAKMSQRREDIIDPVIKASLEERWKALMIQSLNVLQAKLAKPEVNDTVALRCAELGAKALGLGGHAKPPPPDTGADRLERLAARLIALQPQQALPSPGATIDGKVESVQLEPAQQS